MPRDLEPRRPVLALSSRLLWSHPVGKAAEIASDLGFQGLELWTEHLWREGPSSPLEGELARLPLRYFLHGPFMDLNPCSRNPRVAKLSLTEQLKALELARGLGVDLVVVHPGRCSSSKDSPEEYWPALLDSLGLLARRARKLGITLAVENMEPRPKEILVRPIDLERLFGEIPDLGLCLDLAHAAVGGFGMVDEFLTRLGSRIRHVHISNVGDGKVHLPLDKGRLPLTPAALDFLRGFLGALTLEGAWEPGEEVARLGLRRLTELFGGGDSWDKPASSSDSTKKQKGGPNERND